MIPGEVLHPAAPLTAHAEPTIRLEVANAGDRAIQVTSHFHFMEVNRYLRFDRAAAYGMRLDIPVGHAVRFEPGETRVVKLRPIGGRRIVRGFLRFVDGPLADESAKARALSRAKDLGFLEERATE